MITIVLRGDDKVAARVRAMGPAIRDRLIQAVKVQWFLLQGHVVSQKLSGQVLKRVTGNLASSIHVGGTNTSTTFEELPAQIIGRVGTKVKYGRVHEYGGVVRVPAHMRRLTMVFGRDIEPKMISVGAYSARYPERSFLRSSLKDRSESIKQALRAAVREAVTS